MKRAVVAAALLGLSASPLAAGGPGGHRSVSGAYVEARTAEVFTGGCIMNSEAETMGKQAVLAWKVDRGSFNGVSIDGLSVVAAVSGDRNLGMTEMGGEKLWFHPLAAVEGATVGVADQHLFTGSSLGTKWSDPNKRSAFFGTFTY